MAKLWAGRSSGEMNKAADDFNTSLPFDCRMYAVDIKGSIAHATMLAEKNIISGDERDSIITALKEIKSDIDSGKLTFDTDAEDIHMFVEEELTKRIGLTGKKLHTARSRNDQVALDIRLLLRDECDNISSMLSELIEVLKTLAEANTSTIMPGFTHMQKAQPVSFAHHLLAYAFMFDRDRGRLTDCKKRMNLSPLGSCALAGTTYNTDRELTASLLGFDGICPNTMDGVSDRDFALEYLSALSIISIHLSRFCEEIIIWCTSEFSFITLSDAFSTGSSIMPQKKNPDIAELIRGKSGRVFGDLIALLTVMKGIPLAYNKDMQEDKEALFDATDTIKACLGAFTPMLASIKVNKDKMSNDAKSGYINATDCADYLTKKGVPFRDAYKITGMIVAKFLPQGVPLEEVSLDGLNEICSGAGYGDKFEKDFYEKIDLRYCMNERKTAGGPSEESVKEQLKLL